MTLDIYLRFESFGFNEEEFVVCVKRIYGVKSGSLVAQDNVMFLLNGIDTKIVRDVVS